MRKYSGMAVLLGLVAGGGNAEAGLIKLATYEFSVSGSGAPAADPLIRLVLQLPVTVGLDGLGAEMPVFWGEGATGTVDFTERSAPNLTSFLDHATNGVEEKFAIYALLNSGGGGLEGSESELFGMSPDLIGTRIDLVRLHVDVVEITPWHPPEIPELSGYLYDIEGRYEFLGIPEPATVCLLAVGAFVLARRRSRTV